MNPSHVTLAIETSSPQGSLALAIPGRPTLVADFPTGLRHAATLVSRLDGLLCEGGVFPRDVRRIAVSQGPGSFTGLRVGVTLAKTLALTTGAELVPVGTLAAIAYAITPPAAAAALPRVLVLLDARRGQLVASHFDPAPGLPARWIASTPALATFAGHLAAASDAHALHLAGDGLRYLTPEAAALAEPYPRIAEALWTPTAMSVLALSEHLPAVSADSLAPLYLRLPEAEEKYAQGVRSKLDAV